MNGEHELCYDFLSPQRIVFGWGRRREVGSLGQSLGSRAFLISGLPPAAGEPVVSEIADALRAARIEVILCGAITHEPEVDDVDRTAATLRERHAGPGDFVLAVGGGAAIDLAKAAGAMATNTQSPTVKDYLENVGRDLKIVNAPLPVLAMPTTAGTGAEATKNAVISSYDPPFKKSLRDGRLVPRIALLDPELSVSVPPGVTAASGMDAITQLIESFISRKARPIPQALAVAGLEMALPAIGQAVADGSSRPAREKMAHAALLSGMALANSGLGFAHGVAPALGIHCRVPHGLACAVMLPAALRVNREVRRTELSRLARLLIGRASSLPPDEAIEALIVEIEGLCEKIGLPRRLSRLGVKPRQIPALVSSSRGSSMSANPRDVSDAELTALLEAML